MVDVPKQGLASARFWAKWGCDESGDNCAIGQSGGPGQSCGAHGCAPPIDSRFEATFGCVLEGYEVVRAVEACGTASVRPARRAKIAACGSVQAGA